MYTTTPCGTAACVMNAKQHTKSIGGITRAMERNYIWPFALIIVFTVLNAWFDEDFYNKTIAQVKMFIIP